MQANMQHIRTNYEIDATNTKHMQKQHTKHMQQWQNTGRTTYPTHIKQIHQSCNNNMQRKCAATAGQFRGKFPDLSKKFIDMSGNLFRNVYQIPGEV